MKCLTVHSPFLLFYSYSFQIVNKTFLCKYYTIMANKPPISGFLYKIIQCYYECAVCCLKVKWKWATEKGILPAVMPTSDVGTQEFRHGVHEEYIKKTMFISLHLLLYKGCNGC